MKVAIITAVYQRSRKKILVIIIVVLLYNYEKVCLAQGVGFEPTLEISLDWLTANYHRPLGQP